MSKHHIEMTLAGTGDQLICLRDARPEDMRRIRVLYAEVYGASYPMSLISDKLKMRRAIESQHYYWLVAECNSRIVASLIYEVDPAQRIGKAFGAVVSKEFRKQNLANTMMEIVLKEITANSIADTVYATTRTVTTAPQQLTENLGFTKLGIFPNAHKVFDYETHCLAGYFVPAALKTRKKPAILIPQLEPFYKLVAGQLDIGRARIKNPSAETANRSMRPVEPPPLAFETISAPHFIKTRFAGMKNSGVFKDTMVPFHEPNLLLITPDQSTEVFLNYGKQDRYSVILGGKSSTSDYTHILNSVSKTLNEMGVSYIELLVDAYSPDLQFQALNARFIPNAYFPAFRKSGDKRLDYVIFSRSFEMLDFRDVRITSLYREFLKEYLNLWRSMYIESALGHAEE